MELDAAFLNIQHYKVRIKGKVEHSRERSSTLHVDVVAIEKEAFGSPSTTVANFTCTKPHYFIVHVIGIYFQGSEHSKEFQCN